MSDGSEVIYESEKWNESKDRPIKLAETTIINIEEDENSIKISDTTKVENENESESIINVQLLKPFRSSIYDNFDELYARHLQIKYLYVEVDIKKEFNKYTENLLDERYICRNKLLDAIDKFGYKFMINKKDKYNYSGWTSFTDEAFNYRPHQPCIIS
jgi:hypothetical protein